MTTPTSSGTLPSLLSTTFRRSLVLGRLYVAIVLAYSIVLTLALGTSTETAFDSSIPTVLPLFAVMGSLGGMTAFANDRMKGVFEYLIAYGLRPRRLFANSVAASLAVMSIPLGFSVALVIGTSLARWHSLPSQLWSPLSYYSVPMSYACATLACTVGMYWTAVSSPREGMSSPIGLMPLVGIAPCALTLIAVGIVSSRYGPGSVPTLLQVAAASIAALALLLLSQAGRLLRTERLLSPM